MNADGGGLRQLTHVGFATFPHYSPDGRRIAFDAQVGNDPDDEIYVMDTDGRHLQRLTLGAGNNDWPAWSPDGRTIAYTQGDAVEKIWTMDADGSHQRQASTGNADDFGARWSPDGRRLAFVRDFGDGDRPVVVMDVRGGAATALADPATSTVQYVPTWKPRRRCGK